MSGKYALIIASYEYEDAGLRRLVAPPQDAGSLARCQRGVFRCIWSLGRSWCMDMIQRRLL